jgi:chitin synthase
MVFIVADGREKMNKSMVEFLEKDLKVWDTGMTVAEHRNNEVTCHLFEKTVDLPKHSSQREYYKPLQIALAVKEKNGGKLNSHLWFFSAFVKQLQPDYCVVRVNGRHTALHYSIPLICESTRGGDADTACVPC